MEIKWIGNTTFLLKTKLGQKILLDPKQIYPIIQKYDLNPDIITFSHIHNPNILNNYINNDCKILNSPSFFENEFIKIEGIKTYRDNSMGFKRGENIIYILTIDNLKICHLGSLGHKLEDNIMKKLKDVDFLFIPIGGHFSLDGYEASKLAKSINPKYIVPIFFKNPFGYFYLDGPYKFLSSIKNVLTYNTNNIYTEDLSFQDNCSVLLFS
jgi:L-ascorbate metabolism protein UlaG (beta-lactamase superfamily)